MNLKEGFRRFSLIAASIGLFFGIHASRGLLGELTNQTERYQTYTQAVEEAAIQDVIDSVSRMNSSEKDKFESEKFESTKTLFVRRGQVYKIAFSEDYKELKWIVLNEGRTIYAERKPEYFSLIFSMLILPIFGFLIPWGTIRILSWTITRFATPK